MSALPLRIKAVALVALLLSFSACRRSSTGGGSGTPPIAAIEKLVFESRQEIPVGISGIGLRALVVEDFTGDGKLDILVTAIEDQTLILLVAKDGKGGFSEQDPIGAKFANRPGELVAGDFDGDQDMDFAVLFNLEGKLRIYMNDGQGNFSLQKTVLDAGTNGCGVNSMDLNKDKLDDLVFCSDQDKVLVYLADPKGGFKAAMVLSAGSGSDIGPSTLGDFNLDGFVDLAVSDMAKNRIIIWSGTGSGFSGQPLIMPTNGFGPISIINGDFNKDGNPDILVANYTSGQLAWFEGRGAAGFAPSTIIRKLDAHPFHLSPADMNKDGNLDLVIAYWPGYSIGFLAGDGKGGFAAEQQFVTSGQPSMLSVVDLDKDGTLDVLSTATHAKVLSWFRGVADDPRGTGIVSPEKYGMRAKKGVFTGDPVYRFTVSADFDGDGKADCVSSDPFESIVTVYKGSGSGRLLNAGENDQPMELDPGTEPGSISKGDFNNDGKIDFVVAVKGGLRFFLNTSGNGKFSFDPFPPLTQEPFEAGVGPFEVVTADLDGDGVLDLVLSDFAGDKLTILKGSPDGFKFSSLPAVAVKGSPLSIVVKDFNADNKLDIAVSRFRLATVSVFQGDGKGGFKLLVDLPAGADPNYLRTADFNGDGLPDLVVSNLSSNNLGIYFNNGVGFDAAKLLAVGNGPTALIATDFNRDKFADILVSNTQSADFFFLLGDGKGSFSTALKLPGTFEGISAALGDINGDGLPDLMVTSSNALVQGVSLYLNRSVQR